MNISIAKAEVKTQQKLVVAMDVGKEKLTSYSPFVRDGMSLMLSDEIENRSNAIRGAFLDYRKLADMEGFSGVHVLCEPTGGYEKNLLRIARELGFSMAYVNGESVAKLHVVRQNDTGKTDELDPRIIHLAGMQGRQLAVRALPEAYEQLRTLNQIYEQEDKACVMAKNCLNHTLLELFPDLRLTPSQLFSATGSALIQEFGAHPGRIMEAGWPKFVCRMKKHVPKIKTKTLQQLSDDALVSNLHAGGPEVKDLLAGRVCELYSDWKRHQTRKETLKKQMTALYQPLPEYQRLKAISGVPDFLMARLIGETGPLDDYHSARRLLRMGGLNLRERKSGKYKGQNRISKKGRSLLRRVLFQITVLFLLKPGGLYHNYYITRRLSDKAGGTVGLKLTVAVMRHFLVAMHGIYRSTLPFSAERLFTSSAEYKAA